MYSLELQGRVQAAADIVNALKRNPRLKELVAKMETLWLALINLANVSDGRHNQDGIKKRIPSDIMKYLCSLNNVAVPTVSVPVLNSLNYKESYIGIFSFGEEYGLVGGINSPKKITCRGTNGTLYNMLLKVIFAALFRN